MQEELAVTLSPSLASKRRRTERDGGAPIDFMLSSSSPPGLPASVVLVGYPPNNVQSGPLPSSQSLYNLDSTSALQLHNPLLPVSAVRPPITPLMLSELLQPQLHHQQSMSALIPPPMAPRGSPPSSLPMRSPSPPPPLPTCVPERPAILPKVSSHALRPTVSTGAGSRPSTGPGRKTTVPLRWSTIWENPKSGSKLYVREQPIWPNRTKAIAEIAYFVKERNDSLHSDKLAVRPDFKDGDWVALRLNGDGCFKLPTKGCPKSHQRKSKFFFIKRIGDSIIVGNQELLAHADRLEPEETDVIEFVFKREEKGGHREFSLTVGDDVTTCTTDIFEVSTGRSPDGAPVDWKALRSSQGPGPAMPLPSAASSGASLRGSSPSSSLSASGELAIIKPKPIRPRGMPIEPKKRDTPRRSAAAAAAVVSWAARDLDDDDNDEFDAYWFEQQRPSPYRTSSTLGSSAANRSDKTAPMAGRYYADDQPPAHLLSPFQHQPAHPSYSNSHFEPQQHASSQLHSQLFAHQRQQQRLEPPAFEQARPYPPYPDHGRPYSEQQPHSYPEQPSQPEHARAYSEPRPSSDAAVNGAAQAASPATPVAAAAGVAAISAGLPNDKAGWRPHNGAQIPPLSQTRVMKQGEHEADANCGCERCSTWVLYALQMLSRPSS
eukprot:TRINITY_DN1060_c0_g2_i3.p1 TRINITY_DN1060_c0_g2~~TRINITY_DN1060_c0_g2_i3.p1  ORF type:complete len:661 (+),score=172.52 TRINITY_DN1060_c0_g2_i3:92-2074(+)